MIRDITIGQYLPGDSFVHKLDPRIKIILSFAFIVIIFVLKNFYGFAFLALFTAGIIYVARINAKYIFKGLKPIIWIMIFTGLINAFMTPGTILFKVGPMSVSERGLYMAGFMILRLIFLIVCTSLLTLTTSPIALTDGIEMLLGPLKKVGFPAHELAMMMTIALRFIPTLLDETDKIMKAQSARGADFESGNIINRTKNLIPILVPLFISSFRRADELAMAMEARCYRGGKGRTRLKVLKLGYRDYVACSVVVMIFVVSVMSRRL